MLPPPENMAEEASTKQSRVRDDVRSNAFIVRQGVIGGCVRNYCTHGARVVGKFKEKVFVFVAEKLVAGRNGYDEKIVALFLLLLL